MLAAVVTLSTASVFYAQQDSVSRSKDIDQVVLTGVADIAKDRKTPVAVSTIKEAQIIEKLGNQEFPEILNTTPSVYATKAGGGFGDSRINVRGFDQRNTAVMINGVPVNDMENGAVYWSNWAGLSDVTSAMQVQRGLGSSKLAIASVGGTINVLTRAADKKRQGNVTVGVGNDGYHKALFSYNTGKSEQGWASSFLMSRTAGSMYADGTEFEGYNYYFALGLNPQGSAHDLQFTITGAPQWHHQRNFPNSIADYIKYGEDGEPNRRYNSSWGWLTDADGQRREFTMARNYYHKPVMSLNWDWNISPSSKLSTVIYSSFGRGGGTGDAGKINNKTIFALPKTSEGLIDFDNVVRWNQGLAVPAFGANNKTPFEANTNNGIIRRSSINSHNWFGAISSFNHKINDVLNFSVGVDGRYYRGYHYRVVSDLLGNNAYTDTTNKNLTPNRVTNAFDAVATWNPFGGKTNDIKDQIIYSNDGIVNWLGGFGQLEYSNDALSAFVQGSISNQGFRRVDYFILDNANGIPRETDTKNLLGFNVKGGANYNIDENHNVFANVGYYERQPFFGAVFLNNQNIINPDLTNEKIFSTEVGYGFRSRVFNANINLYRTSWDDIYRRISYRDAAGVVYTANILGINEVHQGVEVDFNLRPVNMLTINGMLSVGDWFFKGSPTAYFLDDATNQKTMEGRLDLDGLKVGDAAQLTAALGFDFRPTEWFGFDAMYRYADNLYSSFEPSNRLVVGNVTAKDPALKLPSYGLLDLGASFTWRLNSENAFKLRANVYNVFDKVYISEATTNRLADPDPAKNWNRINMANQVYFGYGRTWSASLSFLF